MTIHIKNKKKLKKIRLLAIVILTFILMSNIKVYSKNIPEYNFVCVEKGDTVWSIASMYSHDTDIRKVVYDICKINNLQNSYIYPGDIIKVPVY